MNRYLSLENNNYFFLLYYFIMHDYFMSQVNDFIYGIITTVSGILAL